MVHWLRVLAEDPGSSNIPPGSLQPHLIPASGNLTASSGSHRYLNTCDTHTDTHVANVYRGIHINKLQSLLKLCNNSSPNKAYLLFYFMTTQIQPLFKKQEKRQSLRDWFIEVMPRDGVSKSRGQNRSGRFICSLLRSTWNQTLNNSTYAVPWLLLQAREQQKAKMPLRWVR